MFYDDLFFLAASFASIQIFILK